MVAAAGRPGLITGDMVKPGAVCVDVGITRTDAGLAGDLDVSVREVAAWVAPMPGGVGPMTRAMLLTNVVERAEAVGGRPEARSAMTSRASGTGRVASTAAVVRCWWSSIGVVIGLAIAVVGDQTWRLGGLIIGTSLLIGAVIRGALPGRDAGLLQVRSRRFDITVLASGRDRDHRLVDRGARPAGLSRIGLDAAARAAG